jgi:multidrug efflux system outer membrane protein
MVQTGAFAQKRQQPPVQTPAAFRADTAPQPTKQSLADMKWFEIFQDQKLQDLIRDALTNNYDLRRARGFVSH